jgi:hypothetical protein
MCLVVHKHTNTFLEQGKFVCMLTYVLAYLLYQIILPRYPYNLFVVTDH